MKKLLTLCTIMVSFLVSATPPSIINGVKDERHTVYAFTHANIHVDSETDMSNAILLVKNGKILDVGKDIEIPEHATIYNLNGATIYPGFILLDSDYGLPEAEKKVSVSWGSKEVITSTNKGAYNNNESIKASYNAVDNFKHDEKSAKALRNLGFGTVLSSRHDGIMRGTSVLVNLDDKDVQESIVSAQQAFHLSFDKGSSKQHYPFSLMGASALLRQTWLDANWYKKQTDGYTDLDLQAVNDNESKVQIIDVGNWQQTLLANKLSGEFNKKLVMRTTGDEYKHIDKIKSTNASLIVPMIYPDALKLNDSIDEWNVSLDKLMAWEAAPYNLFYLHQNKVNFSIAPNNKGHKTFLKDLRKSIKHGLPKSAALAALTKNPANILKNKNLGHLHKGANANFIVSNGDIFSDEGVIAENWVSGKRFIINQLPKITNGKYKLLVDKKEHDIIISNKEGKLKIMSSDKESQVKYKGNIDNEFLTLTIIDDDQIENLMGTYALNSMQNIPGQGTKWSAIRVADTDEKGENDKNSVAKAPVLPKPYSSYGYHKASDAQSFLIQNATVWTNEAEGVLEETDVYFKDGKIISIGKGLSNKADQVIDGTGLHLSAGIIDEHSHIALLSVNDVAVNSSMVRMEDSIDSDDVDIYRNLSGGVVAAQLLHGSANPIGGQSALIKMRWGATSEEMLIKDADKFIKFALGENVKRSSSNASIRFPLTRMGVEQVYRDAFTNAKAYEAQWAQYNNLSNRDKKKAAPPRRDLMLEATLEVINKELFVSCHSYVQSEINMLMKVADDFDFNINTFTHILEGYKVADKMLEHGVGASTFADWWSYKWEVNYAIPYNASIMTKVGVTTAINSDDSEMARRLNQEAAKSVKYGGMSEQEALKMVTLNPAKLLHLDDRMGSIKAGKDADVVLWSHNPLSIYAKANKTFVDGKLLFDRDKQKEIEANIAIIKTSIINKMNETDQPKKPVMSSAEKHMHCDSMTGYEHLIGAAQ